MAQRFIDGLSLEQRLRRDGPLDVPTATRICADVAAGLEGLWAAGMVHRDVKPGNVMLDQAEKAYITDFGLAKDTQGSVLTLPGQALGSMDYMAPEQIRGEEVSAASDIYALGCVMYECLCGRTPFADARGMRVMWAHLQDEPPDPRQFRPELSGRLRAADAERDAQGARPAPGECRRVRTDAGRRRLMPRRALGRLAIMIAVLAALPTVAAGAATWTPVTGSLGSSIYQAGEVRAADGTLHVTYEQNVPGGGGEILHVAISPSGVVSAPPRSPLAGRPSAPRRSSAPGIRTRGVLQRDPVLVRDLSPGDVRVKLNRRRCHLERVHASRQR